MSFDPSLYPYTAVVRITFTSNGQSFQGSGVMLSPDEVLTATHVVYNSVYGISQNIQVTPDYANGAAPFGSASAASVHYNPISDNGSIPFGDVQMDYAIIHLSQPLNAGSMSVGENFAGGTVETAGYPASAGGAMADSVQTVTADFANGRLTGTSLGPGSSGGPVWVDGSNGQATVVGVISGQSGAAGIYAQIDSFSYNLIQSWIAADHGGVIVTPPPPSSPSPLIAELYVGYFDRAPDVGGLQYWVSQYSTPPAAGQSNPFYLSLAQEAASFSDPRQAEAVALYPFLANPKAASYDSVTNFVTSAYSNLFNRVPDTQGLEYWATSIAKSLNIAVPAFGNPIVDGTGPLPAATALLAIINGATGSDAQTIANKVAVGLYYESQVAANSVPFSAASAHNALFGVTFDPATVSAAEASISASIQSAPLTAQAQSSVSILGIPDASLYSEV